MVESNKTKLLRFFVSVTIITILIDQITKLIIFNLKPNLQWGFLKIHYLANTGAGFGLLQDKTILLMIISSIVALVTIVHYKEIPQRIWPQVFTALFLGGVIGNLLDRIFRGFVIDFIDLTVWPAFNMADSAITIGIIGILITMWKKNT